MPIGRVRTGPPATPTQTAAGTDNSTTDPRILTFAKYAIPCIVHNLTGNGNAIRVKWNSSTTSFVTELGYISINDGTATDISMGGLVNVVSLSFITIAGGDDLDNVKVTGWEP